MGIKYDAPGVGSSEAKNAVAELKAYLCLTRKHIMHCAELCVNNAADNKERYPKRDGDADSPGDRRG